MLTSQQKEQLATIVAAGNGSMVISHNNLQYDVAVQVTASWITVAVTVTFNNVMAIFVNSDKNNNRSDSYINQYALNCLRHAKDNYKRRLLETALKLE